MSAPIWQFTYHKGLQQLTGHVYGKDEAEALAEASLWCTTNRCRPPAAVRPFILNMGYGQTDTTPPKKPTAKPVEVA